MCISFSPLCRHDIVWPRDYFSTFGTAGSRWHHLTLLLFSYKVDPACTIGTCSCQKSPWPPKRASGWDKKGTRWLGTAESPRPGCLRPGVCRWGRDWDAGAASPHGPDSFDGSALPCPTSGT